MVKSRVNAEKPGFPVFPRIFFFLIELRHNLDITILHLSAKNQKKTNEPISRKAGNRRTDGRTNERTDNG